MKIIKTGDPLAKYLYDFPNYHISGDVAGMRVIYNNSVNSEDSLLVRCGSYVYNITAFPELYNEINN